MNHVGTRSITTPRLVLRRFTMDDVQSMYDGWASDPEATFYLGWDTHPDVEVTRTVIQTWIEQYVHDGCYNWAIERDGQLIGSILVVTCSDADAYAEIGYSSARSHWGQGYMTEALSAVIGFLFDTVGLHRIYLRYDPENTGSGRVMQKCGLTYEGTLRGHYKRKDGAFGNLAYYGILREEWLEMKGAIDGGF